ncbi:tyrosine-type recombinase/integrase [Mycobacterium palustre]|nr:tyrosine-type recombinase/integrase [Mycobacterium palustre]
MHDDAATGGRDPGSPSAPAGPLRPCGHERSEENTRRRGGKRAGQRDCLACYRKGQAAAKRKRRASNPESAEAANRARIARKRAEKLGLRLVQRGIVFSLLDENNVTLSVGMLGVVDAYLVARLAPRRPGPPRSTRPPESWRRDVDDYLLTLSAAGQRESTIRHRYKCLCMAARGLGCPPAEVTAEQLLNWLGRQQYLSPEGRKNYRAVLSGFFTWMYRYGRMPDYIGDALPRVRVPKVPPRPAGDEAWEAALAQADQRTELMLRLAGEAGLRRAEIAQVHSSHLDSVGGNPQLLVHGKGGKQRIVPISDYLAALIRESGKGWVFPNGLGGHLGPDRVGRLIAGALPGDWTAHTLRHRFATRAYRGSRNLRAVQKLLGHESILSTERYTAVYDDEIRAAATYAW